jgi:hypothetical protein
MRYSVWNQARKSYDYYEAPGSSGEPKANIPAPKHLKHRPLGITPEQASWPLPPGSRKIGAGKLPMGRIAHPSASRALGEVPEGGNMKILLLGVAAFLLWKYVK